MVVVWEVPLDAWFVGLMGAPDDVEVEVCWLDEGTAAGVVKVVVIGAEEVTVTTIGPWLVVDGARVTTDVTRVCSAEMGGFEEGGCDGALGDGGSDDGGSDDGGSDDGGGCEGGFDVWGGACDVKIAVVGGGALSLTNVVPT